MYLKILVGIVYNTGYTVWSTVNQNIIACIFHLALTSSPGELKLNKSLSKEHVS